MTKKSLPMIFVVLIGSLNSISCSDGNEFGTSSLRLSSSGNSSKKTLITDTQDGSGKVSDEKDEDASSIATASANAGKSTTVKIQMQDETELPSVEVAGVNLVLDCFSASDLRMQPSPNNNSNTFEVNCSIAVSKTSKIDIYGAKLETTDTFGRIILLSEQRRHLSVPSSSKKFELIFVSSEGYSAESLMDLSKAKLSFDKILVDNKPTENVGTSVTIKQLNQASKDCPPESQLQWQKQTLTWQNKLPPSTSGTQSEWNTRVDYISPRMSAFAPKDKLPDLRKAPLCGARFLGPLRKIKTDGKPLEDGRHFYSDRFIFLLNSTVLAADDLIKPLRLTSRPTLLNLYDPKVVLQTNMSNVLPQFPTTSQRTNYGNQRFSDTFCAGTSALCFDRPVGGWVNEFSIFNPQNISSTLLRSLLEKNIADGLPIDFGLHLFGNGNSWTVVGDSDGLPDYLQRIELDLELAF